jgi:hypothetical protein
MYLRKVDRMHPAALVLLLDQSLSMLRPWRHDEEIDEDDMYPANPRCRASLLAEQVDTFLNELVLTCVKNRRVRPYFDVAILGYAQRSDSGDESVRSLLQDTTLDNPFVSVSVVRDLASVAMVGEGGQEFESPRWIVPEAEGQTPMAEALAVTETLLTRWIEDHPDSFPPMIFNFTDGEPTSSRDDPNDEVREICERIGILETNDGNALLLSAFIGGAGTAIRYPVDLPEDCDESLQLMFDVASCVPLPLVTAAPSLGMTIESGAKLFLANVAPEELLGLLNIGTVATIPPAANS